MTSLETKRTDRRTNRTRRLLREALLALILERGYDAVTVEEITERADLGRTTFYLHYRDKEELLLESVVALANDLTAVIARTPIAEWRTTPDPTRPQPMQLPLSLAFQHAADHSDLYRIILRGEGHTQMVERIREIIIAQVNHFLVVRVPEENVALHPGVPQDVFANYFAGAFLGVLTWWLENDLPYPPDEMATYFQKILYDGAQRVLDIPER
ncbi:MAG TPA: TetR/AcrR family transcriptional regulator [Anaerolineaceae bacterium]|jgi:AcrR family transcriptional regulator